MALCKNEKPLQKKKEVIGRNTDPVNKLLLAGTDPVNKLLLTGTLLNVRAGAGWPWGQT